MTNVRQFLGVIRTCSHSVLGIPSYDGYLAHVQQRHPDTAPMTRGEFFRERQDALFGGGSAGRCC
jgi:uncharacterized short protein YbdD (DUF466 family)